MSLQELNCANSQDQKKILQTFCTSDQWCERLQKKLPAKTKPELISWGIDIWEQELAPKDYLQAFAGHPMIGDWQSLKKKFKGTEHLTSKEQGQVKEASDQVLQELQTLNQEYLKKFQFIFIVCATGKSAEEMLGLIKKRLKNSASEELKNAHREQKEIMRLRMEAYL
jgi:2-oxo-4-hydroxy-4-carboxy-5-ureidoimidazoline decarboxylase